MLGLQYFIRLATASTIARRVRLLHEPLKKAAQNVVQELHAHGGLGGVIALDHKGNGKVIYIYNCDILIIIASFYAHELPRNVSSSH
jgi:isoaspartyl peptidase/L-asparaginase-like protein (Ntn-hydrolase superfamily)